MKFSTATIVLATVSSVTGAAVYRRDAKSDAQRDYDIETGVLKERGLCRAYEGISDPEYSKFTDLCEPTCGDARAIVDQTQQTYSVSCAVTGTTVQPTFTDPDGADYQLGQCLCNLPIINWLGDNFVAALPALGQVTCAVWKEAAQDAAKMLAGTYGVGTAKTGVQALIKVAKMLAKEGKSVNEWEDYVKKHVEAGDACDLDLNQMWEDAKDVADEFIANVGGS